MDTGLNLSLTAEAGEYIEVGLIARETAAAVNMCLSAATIVSGAVVNWIDGHTSPTSSSSGLLAWFAPTGVDMPIGGSVIYEVQAGDVEVGVVTVRLRYRGDSATDRTMTANSFNPLTFWGRVLG